MRMRELFSGALLLFVGLIQMSAGPMICPENEPCPNSEDIGRRVPKGLPVISIPEPAESIRKDEILETAYYDAMKILVVTNQCSAFFGGSRASVDVFQNFMSHIKKSYLPSSVGLKMSGDYMNVLNAETNLKYRLFEKASINTSGPFYKQKASATGSTIASIGSFPPNSREARVLMLLHELGHLMRGADGNWLLPDDGNSVVESLNNTRTVESACGEQIRSLAKGESEIVRQNNLAQTVSPAAATSSHQ
jgi:hypothetical protein